MGRRIRETRGSQNHGTRGPPANQGTRGPPQNQRDPWDLDRLVSAIPERRTRWSQCGGWPLRGGRGRRRRDLR